jgi:hypothetical protein
MLVLNKNDNELSLGTARYLERLDGFSRARNVMTGEVQALTDTLLIPARSPLILELLKD